MEVICIFLVPPHARLNLYCQPPMSQLPDWQKSYVCVIWVVIEIRLLLSGSDHHGSPGDVLLDRFGSGLQHVQRRHVRVPGWRNWSCQLRKLPGYLSPHLLWSLCHNVSVKWAVRVLWSRILRAQQLFDKLIALSPSLLHYLVWGLS